MSVQIKIETNASEITRGFKRFPSEMASAIAKAMDKENDLTLGNIRRNHLTTRGSTSTQNVTGKLRNSVYATKANVTPARVTSEIGSNVFYALIQELGVNKTWTIKARNKKVLADKKKGIIFGRQVTHPGLIARNMFRTGIEERAENYQTSMQQAVADAWEKAL